MAERHNGRGEPSFVLLLVLIMLLSASVWSSAATLLLPDGQGPNGHALYLWDVNESLPSGSASDPRLDMPVKLWRPGISLKELFDAVGAQTGVLITCDPPGDQNERIRVNVYLNPKSPPSLRALMAQLTWVIGCSFAYTTGDDDHSDWRYYLLRTSSGYSVAQQIAEENAQRNQESAQTSATQRRENQQAARAKLTELAQALELTQQNLIYSYRGNDNLMLLTALDPARREVAIFTCHQLADKEYLWDCDSSLEPEAMFAWQDLPTDERSAMEQALGFSANAIVGSDQIRVTAGGMTEGRVTIRAMAHYVEGGPLKGRNYWHAAGSELTLIDASGEPGMTPQDSVALLRLLGTPLDSGEARKMVKDEWERSRQDETDRLRESVRKEAASYATLSTPVEALLAGTLLSIDGEASYPLWRVQEMVAEVCGMNAISDCFWQDARRLDWDISMANPGWKGSASALQALQASCQPSSALDERLRLFRSNEESRVVRWEWGDAGSFLHFRSVDRDIWRGSMIPTDVQAEINSLLAAELAKWLDCRPPASIWQYDIDESSLFRLVAIASKLDDLQLIYGRHMAYENPADDSGSRQLALRRSFLGLAAENLEAIRLLGSLSRTQWQYATADGLLVRDMSEPQVALALDLLQVLNVTMSEETLEHTRMTVELASASTQTTKSPSHFCLRLWLNDCPVAFWDAPPKLTARLEVAPEPKKASSGNAKSTNRRSGNPKTRRGR